MSKKWINQHKKKIVGALIGVDCLFFGLTSPDRVPAVVLVFGFALLVANLYVAVSALVALMRWYGISIGRHKRKIIIALTASLSVLVALQSTGQLTSRDLLVLLPFVALAYFYTSYQKA